MRELRRSRLGQSPAGVTGPCRVIQLVQVSKEKTALGNLPKYPIVRQGEEVILRECGSKDQHTGVCWLYNPTQ